MNEDLHREIIEEHARHPRNKRELPDADLTGEHRSPKTGNDAKVYLRLDDAGKVSEATFTGQGSALSQASGSILATHAPGLTLDELLRLAEQVERAVLQGAEEALPGETEVYRALSRFPERHDCALLAWRALKDALKNEESGET